jgi:hypothetical protein
MPALTIVDLACDTGAMLLALASALQNGKLVDNDLDLLVRAADVFNPARSDNHANRSWTRSQSGTRSFARSGQAPLIVSDSWLELLVTDVAARASVLRGANLRRQDHI